MSRSNPRAKQKESDEYRGYTHLDTLHLRLFNVAFVEITTQTWRTTNVCSSYWRFYANDADGASLLVREADGEKYPFPLNVGESFLVPAGVRFDCRCTAPSIGHFYVHFEVIGLPGILLRELFNRPLCIPRSSGANEKTSEIALHLKQSDELVADNLVLFCRTKSLIYDAFAASLNALRTTDRERYTTHAQRLEPVLPALEIVEKHFAEPLPNSFLAGACYFSEDYFIRLFKECVGESPAQYIQRRRVETAANRLLFSTDSIEQIATDCGFGNRFHFTRVFTNRLGIAPAAYRKEGRV